MGNESCSQRRTWYELYREAESTYELDTSANEESIDSLYSGESDLDDEMSADDVDSSAETVDINDVLPDSIKYDASGVVNAERAGLYIGSIVYLRVPAGEDGSTLSVVDFDKYVQDYSFKQRKSKVT